MLLIWDKKFGPSLGRLILWKVGAKFDVSAYTKSTSVFQYMSVDKINNIHIYIYMLRSSFSFLILGRLVRRCRPLSKCDLFSVHASIKGVGTWMRCWWVNHESGSLGVLSLWHSKKKMGRAPCCEKVGLKRGPWTPEEDLVLMAYIHKYGHDNWRALPKRAGLSLTLLASSYLFTSLNSRRSFNIRYWRGI